MVLRSRRVKWAREAHGHEIWRMRRQGLSALHAKRPPEAARAGNGLEALHPADGAARRLAARRAATPGRRSRRASGSTFWSSVSERSGIVMEIAADHDSVTSLPWLVRR